MANTITNLIPTIYEALDTVSRELVGFIPSVWRNPEGRNLERAALDQTIRFPISPAATAADNTPGQTAPNTGDQTIGSSTLTISKSRHVPIRWNGEQTRSLQTGDTPRYSSITSDQFAQAFRTLVNEMETDLGSLYTKCSRAYGTAATPPFGSSLTEAAQIRKILDDNGAPITDRSLIVDTTAGVNLRELTNLNQVNTSGTDATLRQGVLLPIMGLDVRESAQVAAHTAGTMTGADCTATEPVGEVTIACDGSDAGTVLAGDVVTRGNEGGGDADTNKYVVNSGSTLTGNATGNFIMNAPGVRLATTATDEWTIGAAYTANMAFQKNAVVLITRLPAMPEGGDMATDTFIVQDPMTGIAFEVAIYKEYLQNHIQIRAAWGYSVVKPEHCAILLG